MINEFIPQERFFPYLTWQEIQEMSDKKNVVIIQPVGAIEQHGPHLPLIVDSAIVAGVLGKALSQLASSIPAYALPPLYYGKSNEHCNFPGTISLSARTVLSIIQEVGDSIYKAGFRKLVLLNGHGGQPQVMEIIARDLHEKYRDLAVFPLFVWGVPNISSQLLAPQELIHGIHAGDAETSLMLSLLPSQVHMELAVKEYPPSLKKDTMLSIEGDLPFAWLTHELSRSGVIGDATTATKEKGDRLLDSLASGWVKVIEDIYDFQLPEF